jgi:hypothetical protein
MAWTLFYHPVQWSSDSLLWLVLPLSAALAIVYKTVRTRDLRRLPLEVLVLMVLLVVGMVALGVGLWLVQEYGT